MGLTGDRPYGTILQAAMALRSANVVVGASEQGVEWETDQINQDWERISESRESIQVTIQPDGEEDPTCIDPRPTDAKP